MSILTDLRAACNEARAAGAAWDANPYTLPAKDRLVASVHRMEELFTEPNIRALLDVAEAAEHEPYCPFCGAQRRVAGWPMQPHLSDCPLAPLVKEADDE